MILLEGYRRADGKPLFRFSHTREYAEKLAAHYVAQGYSVEVRGEPTPDDALTVFNILTTEN